MLVFTSSVFEKRMETSQVSLHEIDGVNGALSGENKKGVYKELKKIPEFKRK